MHPFDNMTEHEIQQYEDFAQDKIRRTHKLQKRGATAKQMVELGVEDVQE